MSPYNYPLNETFTTFIPALVMGNVTILKPARYGVVFWKHFLPLFQKHFPAGVVNTVYGDGEEIITPLMTSGDVKVLAFIGSGGVAKKIASVHPNSHELTQILGLGAKNPKIITETADIPLSTVSSVESTTSYNQQRCTAAKILMIQANIYDTFVTDFVREIEKLKIGMSHTYYTNVHSNGFYVNQSVIPTITPLPEPGKIQEMHNYIKDALSKGATILNKNGGEYYHRLMVPAVLGGVTKEMNIYHEEQFGPIIPLVKYDSIEEPIEWIINSQYGQQASIHTTDMEQYKYFKSQVRGQISRLNLNRKCQRGPDQVAFSGTKGSAVGTLSIREALLRFSDDFVEATNDN